MRRRLPAAIALGLAACRGGDAGRGDGAATLAELPSPAAAGARWPNLAADDSGRVYLTWLEPAGVAVADTARARGARVDTVWRVRFATLDRGAGAWSAPRTVAEGGDLVANWADFPAVVPLGGGRIAAQWPVRDRRARFAYAPRVAQSADGGATWTAPVAPQRSDSPVEFAFAVLFPSGVDSLGVAWLDGRAGAADKTERYSLYFTAQAPDGTLGREQVVDTLTCSCCRSSVATTRRGAVVAFRDRTEQETRDVYVRRYEGGAWSAPTPVHADGWRIEGCPVNGTATAARGDTVVVAWYTGAGGAPRAQLAFSADGGRTFGAPVRADDGKALGRVGVALTARGDAVVSWLERVGADSAELRVRRVGADGARGDARGVARSAASRAAGMPQLVAAGDTAYLAWTVPGVAGAPPAVRVARLAVGRGGL